MIIRNAKEMTESVDLFGGFLEAEERWIPRTQDSNQYDNTCNQTEVKNLAIDWKHFYDLLEINPLQL